MTASTTHTLSRQPRSLIGALLLIAGSAWLGVAIWDSASQFGGIARSIRLDRLAAAELPALASMWINAAVYYLLLSRMVPALPGFPRVVSTYLTSQLARYTPGKVWSIVYLSRNLSGWVSARQNWTANLEQMLIININSIGLAAAAFLYDQQYRLGAPVPFIVTIGLLYLGLKQLAFERVVQLVAKRQFGGLDSVHGAERARATAGVISLLQLDWLVFFLVWALILPPSSSLRDIVATAISYAIAYLVGFYAFVVPGGLLVREASFVWLGGLVGLDKANLLVFGVIARFLLTITDVIAALSGLLVARLTRS